MRDQMTIAELRALRSSKGAKKKPDNHLSDAERSVAFGEITEGWRTSDCGRFIYRVVRRGRFTMYEFDVAPGYVDPNRISDTIEQKKARAKAERFNEKNREEE